MKITHRLSLFIVANWLLCTFFSTTLLAQKFSAGDATKGILESKNVTVDYSTGLIHYSVPFSFMSVGEEIFPISFNYTSNTSHVGDNSGMLGIGWHLNYGGVVSRTVRGGIPDETWLIGIANRSRPYRDSTTWDMVYSVNKRIDGENDLFTVSVAGKSIQFFIERGEVNGRFRIIPLSKSDVKIECIYSESPTSNHIIDGWILTDEKGIKYTFTAKEWITGLYYQTEAPLNGFCGNNFISAWYLTEICVPGFPAINYEYDLSKCYSRIYDSKDVNRNGENHLSSSKIRYNYSPLLPMNTYSVDYTDFINAYRNAIQIAINNINVESLRIQCERLYASDFTALRFGIVDMIYDYVREQVGEYSRVLGILASSANITADINKNLSSLNSILASLYSLPHSSDIQVAIHAMENARYLLIESVSRSEEILSQTVRNGHLYTVYSPLPKRIINNDKKIIIHSRFDNHGANVVDSISEYDNYGTLLNRAILYKSSSIGTSTIKMLDSLCFYSNNVLCDVVKFQYHHRDSKYKNTIYDYDIWNQWLPDSSSATFEYGKNYSTRFLLREITNINGAKISLDYETNEFALRGALYEVGNGNRIKQIRLSQDINAEDTISYTYPLPAVFENRDITHIITLNYTSVTGAKDILNFDKIQKSGFLLSDGGNNGLHYPMVVEHYHGNGYNSYLYSIPLPDLYNRGMALPHWNLSLPLAKAVYTENGRIVSLEKNKYYSDTILILQPETYYKNYSFAQSEWYVKPPFDISQRDTLYQVEKNPYFIERDDSAMIYKSTNKFPTDTSEYEHYRYNLHPRTYLRWREQRYRILYGGNVVPYSQESYIFPSTENELGLGPRIEDLAGAIPSGAILQNRTTYFYDNASITATPTRICREGLDGIKFEEHIFRPDAFAMGVGMTDSLKLFDKNGEIVMRNVYRTVSSGKISLSQDINTYRVYDDTIMLSDKVYHGEFTVNSIPEWSIQNSLFSRGKNNYRKESELSIIHFNNELRKGSSVSLHDTTCYRYEKNSQKPILQISNVGDSLFDALSPLKNTSYKLRKYSDSNYETLVDSLDSYYYLLRDFCNLHDATHNGNYSDHYYYFTSDTAYQICLDFSRKIVNHSLDMDVLPLIDSVKANALYLWNLYGFYDLELHECGVECDVDRLPFVLLKICSILESNPVAYNDISSEKYDTRSILHVKATNDIRRFKLYSVVQGVSNNVSYKPKSYLLKGSDTINVNIVATNIPNGKWILHSSNITIGATRTPCDLYIDVSHDSVAVAYCAIVPIAAQFDGYAYHLDDKVACSLNHKGEMIFAHFTPEGEIAKITDEQGRILTQYEYSPLRQVDGYTKTYTNLKKSDTLIDYLTHVDYFDSQRRVVQSIDVDVYNSSDLINVHSYGSFGRIDKSYAPFSKSGNTGSKITTPFAEINWSEYGYSEMSYMYTENRYENSPLNRQIAQIGTGQAWKSTNKKVTYQNYTNLPNQVYHLLSSSDGGVHCVGYYEPGLLYSKRTVDEDGLSYLSYYNSMGEMVLSRKESVIENIDTYYVYDEFGRLSYVLTPEMSSTLRSDSTYSAASLLSGTYHYIYDECSRIVEKHFPSPVENSIYYIYDLHDRIIMSQDASMREKDIHRWSYYEYDRYDRKVECGEIVLEYFTNRQAIANAVKLNGGNLPPGVKEPQSYFLYDSYTATSNVTPISYLPITGHEYQYSTNVIGKPVAAKYKILGDNVWRTETMYYDSEGRLKQLVYENAMGGVSRNAYSYDESDRLILETEKHTALRPMIAPRIDVYREYSKWGNLNSIEYCLDSVSVSKTQYKYDALGRETSVTHNSGSNKFTDSYTYNVKGWLKRKNNKFFRMNLYYNDAVAKPTNRRYNGTISEVDWRSGTDTTSLYSYTYDSFGRLKSVDQYIKDGSVWSAAANANTERNIAYDKNSNILTMTRLSLGDSVDSLSYSYAGDRLISLTEHINNETSHDIYKRGGISESSFEYDANGNMLLDTRNGIQIEYNTLNLPCKVWQNNSLIATYSYLADGTKLSINPIGKDTLAYAGSLIVQYDGYGWKPKSVLTKEGQIEYNNTISYENKVFIRDNLGSVRAVWNGNLDSIESRIDYYPFGAEHLNNTQLGHHKPRYRFSGKENQSEAMDGILDFGSRYYNPQIGRWLHRDPQSESYYQYSPYTYCANNPMNLVDPYGERIVTTDFFRVGMQDTYIYEWIYENNKWQFVDFFTREPYVIGTNSYVDALTQVLERIMSRPIGKSYIEELTALDEIVLINYDVFKQNINKYIPLNGSNIFINDIMINLFGAINWYSPKNMKNDYFVLLMKGKETEYNIETSTYVLVHELGHFYDHVKGRNMEKDVWESEVDSQPKISESEKYAMYVENIIRVEHGSDVRIRYFDSKGYSPGFDFIIDLQTGRSLSFKTGNIFDTKILKLEKHELGYKYK